MNKALTYLKLDQESITAVRGIKAAGVHCGLKKSSRDLALFYSESPAAAAGVFTQNLVQAAPVLVDRERINNPIRAVVVNSGNANACTGEKGMEDARQMADLAAAQLHLPPEQILVCSTGVIGMPLPMDKIAAGIASAAQSLSGERQAGLDAAAAILTTDTVTKTVVYRGDLPSGSFTLAGTAKGAGMICPNMATMLAFIFTDAAISRPLLNSLFREAVDCTFNAITIDGDTSTNDTALILANGAASVEITEGTPECDLFARLLHQVCQELAVMIVSDGEGVTKVITLEVTGAPDAAAARTLARTVLNSPLVKTAFYGEDANWGRILAALGYAGVPFDPSRVDIAIGPVRVACRGGAIPFDEAEAKAVLQQREIKVTVNLNAGTATATAWGTDLSHDYVSINSSYRS